MAAERILSDSWRLCFWCTRRIVASCLRPTTECHHGRDQLRLFPRCSLGCVLWRRYPGRCGRGEDCMHIRCANTGTYPIHEGLAACWQAWPLHVLVLSADPELHRSTGINSEG